MTPVTSTIMSINETIWVGGKLVTATGDSETGDLGDGGSEDDLVPFSSVWGEGNTLLALVVCTGDAGGMVSGEVIICVSSSSCPGPILVSWTELPCAVCRYWPVFTILADLGGWYDKSPVIALLRRFWVEPALSSSNIVVAKCWTASAKYRAAPGDLSYTVCILVRNYGGLWWESAPFNE